MKCTYSKHTSVSAGVGGSSFKGMDSNENASSDALEKQKKKLSDTFFFFMLKNHIFLNNYTKCK